MGQNLWSQTGGGGHRDAFPPPNGRSDHQLNASTVSQRSVVEGAGKGFVGTYTKFARPRYHLIYVCCPGVLALIAGTHPRCGARSPVAIMGTHGEALVRILVDFVALVLTEQRLCFDVWGLLPCREKWMARFCLTVSPLFGITSDVIELEYSSDPTKPLSEEDWWQAENTLWEVVCYPKVCCRCDPLKNMRLISKAGGREDALVPFDGVMGHVVVSFVGLDRVTPNELLLIVSQEGKLATVIHMVIDLESSFTSKSLVVLDKAAFKWPFRMDPRKAQCEVISAFAMRKPTGQRAFLSYINWYQTSKSEVIEFVEGSGTTRVLASFELQCHISKFSESLFFLFSWNPPAGWSYTLWDCSGSTSAPIQCFQLVECTDDDLELDSKTTGTGVAVYCVPPNGIRVVELLSCVTVLNIELIGAPAPAYRIQFE